MHSFLQSSRRNNKEISQVAIMPHVSKQRFQQNVSACDGNKHLLFTNIRSCTGKLDRSGIGGPEFRSETKRRKGENLIETKSIAFENNSYIPFTI